MGSPSPPPATTPPPTPAQIEADAAEKRGRARNAAYDSLALQKATSIDAFFSSGLGLFLPGTGYATFGEGGLPATPTIAAPAPSVQPFAPVAHPKSTFGVGPFG